MRSQITLCTNAGCTVVKSRKVWHAGVPQKSSQCASKMTSPGSPRRIQVERSRSSVANAGSYPLVNVVKDESLISTKARNRLDSIHHFSRAGEARERQDSVEYGMCPCVLTPDEVDALKLIPRSGP